MRFLTGITFFLFSANVLANWVCVRPTFQNGEISFASVYVQRGFVTVEKYNWDYHYGLSTDPIATFDYDKKYSNQDVIYAENDNESLKITLSEETMTTPNGMNSLFFDGLPSQRARKGTLEVSSRNGKTDLICKKHQ